MLRIRFQKRTYVLDGDLRSGGPIATRYQYRHGLCSFAHLFKDGAIKQFGKQIGTRDDLKVLGSVAVKPASDAFDNMLSDRGGFPPEARLYAMGHMLKALTCRD